jgi:hypothetical protein
VLQGANGQGRVEIYTYNEQYEDETGDTQSIMGSYDVIGTGGALQGTRCFGAIRDKRAGLAGHVAVPEDVGSGRPERDLHDDAERSAHVPGKPNNSFRMSVKN